MNNCNITTIITPGIPKNPTNNADSQLISKVNPRVDAPNVFIKYRIAPPTTAFNINPNNVLNEKDNNFKIIHNITSPPTNAIIVCIDKFNIIFSSLFLTT